MANLVWGLVYGSAVEGWPALSQALDSFSRTAVSYMEGSRSFLFQLVFLLLSPFCAGQWVEDISYSQLLRIRDEK